MPYATRQQKLGGADEALVFPRLAADAVIAAFFSAESFVIGRMRLAALRGHSEAMLRDPTDIVAAEAVEGAVTKLRQSPKGVYPFTGGWSFQRYSRSILKESRRAVLM